MIDNIYKFDLKTGNGNKIITIYAETEESARRKLVRRRNDYGYSYSSASSAKLIDTITTSNVSIVNQILDSLKVETTSFKKTYLDMMEKHITENFDTTIEKFGHFTYEMWLDMFGEDVKSFNRTYRRMSSHGQKLMSKTQSFQRILNANGKEDYIKKEIDLYSQDFDNKLQKLAVRMDKKGFKSNIKVTSTHVGVNFDCWVTDGEKTAHAYTIIASGPIISPHYRYLVK